MKTRLFYLALIVTILLPVTINAISEAACIFLLIEPGSRPGALGSAYVAQVDDAFAGYWNTGALAFNRKTQFAGMHTNWFGQVAGLGDMYYEYLAWNQYFEEVGNLGFNILYFTAGTQEAFDGEGNSQGTFTTYEFSVSPSYSFQLNENTGLGLAFKFIYSNLVPASITQGLITKGYGMSYAFDLGWKQKNLFIDDLDFGLNFQNIGPNIIYENEAQAEPLPMNWRMGLSYKILNSAYNKLTVNTDMNKLLANDDALYKRIFTAWIDDAKKDEWEAIIFNAGAEYVYLDLLSLRVGYISDRAGSIVDVSFGAGIHYTFSNKYNVAFDFAMQPGGDLQRHNQTFSVKVEF